MNKLFTYLKQAKEEFKKITWPTRKETINYSLLVVVISFILAAYIGVLDYALDLGVKEVVEITADGQPSEIAPTEATPIDQQIDLNSEDIQIETSPATEEPTN